jgi:hypothetical protein
VNTFLGDFHLCWAIFAQELDEWQKSGNVGAEMGGLFWVIFEIIRKMGKKLMRIKSDPKNTKGKVKNLLDGLADD